MKLQDLKNKSICILGFGKEGQDTFLALRNLFPQKPLAVADQNPDIACPVSDMRCPKITPVNNFQRSHLWKLHLGRDYLMKIKNYDVIIKTPGISLKKIKPFIKKGQIITSQTEIFLENCPGTVVGITGTKGKGTTATLIYEILKAGGKKTKLLGNIGSPVFQELLRAKKNDIFVYEMSSHQLEGLKISPPVAVFLNLYPAHLDYYGNFANYKKAKENIALHQGKGDWFIYNQEDKNLRNLAKKTKARKMPILATKYEKYTNIRKRLIGKFNNINIAMAAAVGELFNVPKNKILEAIKQFKPLPHRLEFVGKFRGIEFYNDSLATVPESTVAAIEALGPRLTTLIIGGEKIPGIDFSGLAQTILKSKIKNLILFPDTDIIIRENIQRSHLRHKFQRSHLWKLKKKTGPGKAMEEAVKIACEKTKKGEMCLLSPGAPSLNMFKNYAERGELYKKFVKYYGKKSS